MSADDERYYILDRRQVVGNCALWWCPDGKGYTCDLDAAGKYSWDEASSNRDTDVPVPCELAERLVVKHVRFDHVRQNTDSNNWKPKAARKRAP
jgi:hypothetical protein